jgi:hypothetical protein
MKVTAIYSYLSLLTDVVVLTPSAWRKNNNVCEQATVTFDASRMWDIKTMPERLNCKQ